MPVVQHSALQRRLVALCAWLVIAIIGLSAFIRLSHDGLGCADWPQCYGQRLQQAHPAGVAKVVDAPAVAVARAAHRVAAVAALGVILMMIGMRLTRRPVAWREGWMECALLALALFLAVLGRYSSGARVPAVTLGNLLGGFAMLALCWRLRQRMNDTTRVPLPRALRLGAVLALLALLGQIALGGLVSAGYAGLSCGPADECVALAARAQAAAAFNPWREPAFALASVPGPVNPDGAALHLAHRLGGVLTAALVLGVGGWALRCGRVRQGRWILAALVTEVVLGLLMVALGLPLALTLAHNLGAAALLALLFGLATARSAPA